MPRYLHTLVGLALIAVPVRAQAPLTLHDALALADRRAYSNRIAEAAADTRRAEALQTYRGILPALRVEAGYVRTTDPIAAFGTKLRQREIGPADLSPAELNSPTAIGNRSTGLVLEQPLFNADAWTGRSAAGAAAKAEAAAADWTRASTRVNAVRAYFGATLAAEKRATLEAAERAALAHVARARALADTGLVTRSDALLAEVRGGEITMQRLAAVSDAAHARRALAMLLGASTAAVDVPEAMPAANAIRALLAADSLGSAAASPSETSFHETRADVRAATLALSAARADARRAKSLFLPRVNGFARYDWNDRTSFFANPRSWSAGVMATWSPFTGAHEIAESRLSEARERSATARRDAATANASLEAARTRDALADALVGLGIAERAVMQSAEALRIVARRYDGGLATISELLEAQGTSTQAHLGFSLARYQLIVAAADRRQAIGGDVSFLTALDRAAPTLDRAQR